MKTFKRVAVVVIACICTMVCLIGCANQVRKVTATTQSYRGDQVFEETEHLEIKVKFSSAYATPGGTNFYSDNTLSQLKEQIDKQKKKDYSLETKEYGENFLLIDETKDGYGYRYLLVRYEQTSAGGWRYEFMGLKYIPYHLFGDVAYEELTSSGGYLELQTNYAYPSECGIDEFYDFYKEIEACSVTKEENVLVFKSIGGTMKIRFDETQSGTTVTYLSLAQ
ncbi:MAG: hypothetical protein K2J30_00010 [Clostridia bacterium]|nr:hypothetical protein [Clostridia bacterium]